MNRPARHSPHPNLLQAQVMRLMRPLVRLMIGSGIPFPAFMDLVRKTYVDVAESDFRLDGKEQTDSRITLLTGVHRKEVRRLRSEEKIDTSIPPELSLTSQIVARWIGSPVYSDSAGKARPLARSGPEPSFESLVTSVTKDMRSRAVLDEWLDRGLVEIDAEDRVTLVEAAMLPRPGEDNQLYYFGRNLHDHVAAATSNVGGGERLFLDRSVHYDGLSLDQAQKLESLSRELATQALQSANAEAQTIAGAEPAGAWRWNFGLYIYVEPQDDAGKPEGGA